MKQYGRPLSVVVAQVLVIASAAIGSLSISFRWCNAQGALDFNNSAGGLVVDLVGVYGSPFPWLADLYYGPVGAPECLLAPLHEPAEVRSASFEGGIKTIPNYAPGTVISGQVRVWNGAYGFYWDNAVLSTSPDAHIALSPIFQLSLANPATAPPSGLPYTDDYYLRLNDPPTTWPPRFQASVVLTNMLLFYWEGRSNYRLQQNPTLNSTNWVTLTNVPWTDWYKGQIAIPKPSQPMFYRLLVVSP